MDLYFFNAWGNGDVHVSRGFVKDLVSRGGFDNYYYTHRHPSSLLSDVPKLGHVPMSPENTPAARTDYGNPASREIISERNGYIIVNTWYETMLDYSSDYKGALFETLYDNFSVVYERLGLKISDDPLDYFPDIDFGPYKTEKTEKWVKESPFKAKILICNEQCGSKQTNNYDLSPVINSLASKLSEAAFIITNKEAYSFDPPPNVFFASDIVGVEENLNEISFLSTHCALIFGRGSGVCTFTMTKQNLDKLLVSNWRSLLARFASFSEYQNVFPLITEDPLTVEHCLSHFIKQALDR